MASKAAKLILMASAAGAAYMVYKTYMQTKGGAAIAVIPPTGPPAPIRFPSFLQSFFPPRRAPSPSTRALPLQRSAPVQQPDIVQTVAAPVPGFLDGLSSLFDSLPDISFVGSANAAPVDPVEVARLDTLTDRPIADLLAPDLPRTLGRDPIPRPREKPLPAVTDQNVDILARTIWGEARNQSRAGKEAVANVVMNRVRSGRYPSTPKAVCLQRKQFSAWNEGDPNRVLMQSVTSSNRIFRECQGIAQFAVGGFLADRTGGALHYYADYIAAPYWADGPNVRQTAKIGTHIFVTGVS